MLTRENIQRRSHVYLSSQQRRLRHVTSISARNITPTTWFSNLNNLGTYFTLHFHKDCEAFYTSETTNSFNPTWQSFDTRQISQDLNTSSTCFIVRIWGGENGDFRLLIEWSIDLYGLTYLGDKIKQDGDTYEPNSIIFGLQDGFYVAPKPAQAVTKHDEQLNRSLLKVDQELVRSSYNLSSLHRLHTLVRAIRQTQLQIRAIKCRVKENLHMTKDHLHQASECDRLKLCVKILREELQKHKKRLNNERKKEYDLTDEVKRKGEDLLRRKDGFEGVKANFDEAKDTHIAKRETLVKTNAQLLMRRKHLCHELTYIYPMELLTAKGQVVVCGLPLPNTQSQEFSVADDETISGAFGYVSHLVAMIGKIFQVPLRYPFTLKGSRTTVSDYVNEQLLDKDRNFPLFVKGKEKVEFEFGVFLLNKDIAQIRFCLGLSTADLRLTLPNVKSLFDTKFGGSCPYHSSSVNVISRALSPTNQQQEKDETDNAQTATGSNDLETMVTEELRLVDVPSFQDHAVSHMNGQGGETSLSKGGGETLSLSKPQTVKHKFLTGSRKSSSSSMQLETKTENITTET